MADFTPMPFDPNRATVALALLALLTCASAGAQPCLDNFTAEGNFLTGKSYKTSAVVAGVRPADAFNRIYAFTADNGFQVLSASKEAGVISAAQSASYGNGKTVPLNVTVREDPAGTRVALSYATGGGMLSPEDAIKRHFCLTVAAAEGASPAATATQPPSPGPAPASPPPVAAAPAPRSAMRGFALISAEQQQAIRQEVPRSVPNDRIRPLASEAAPTVAAFIERLSCLADFAGGSAMNEFAAPGVELGNYYAALRPMRSMQYHNKAACLTVTRVHGWVAPANNALRFEVLYRADDSGETAKQTHEMVRQPDGVWLFRQ